MEDVKAFLWYYKREVIVLAFLSVAMGYGMVKSSQEMAERKAIFYEMCLQDHKEYECDVLYQHAQPKKRERAPIYISPNGNVGIPM